MQIDNIIRALECWAPLQLQETYDNAGLITGNPIDDCSGVLCCLDATEKVIEEAIRLKCNMVVAHHPIIFKGLKKVVPRTYVERAVIKAIKNDIAIYALHTNLDNINTGVNNALALQLGLVTTSLSILAPQRERIAKLYTYVPEDEADALRNALFDAGGGAIGLYHECSFNTHGLGTFKPMPGSNPVIGQSGGIRELVPEIKIEILFPAWMQQKMVAALHKAHRYEVPAYEVILLENEQLELGAGMTGELPHPMTEAEWLGHVKDALGLQCIKHTAFTNKPIRKVALCGGSGSFLLQKAIAAGADTFITADVKYHEFFDADGHLLLLDAGHGESEACAIRWIANYLQDKFPTFAVLKTGVRTNPVYYY